MAKAHKLSITSTTFSKPELKMYCKPIEKRYGIKTQVALLSGLSTRTVSRAWAGQNISKDAKQKIIKAIFQVITNTQTA